MFYTAFTCSLFTTLASRSTPKLSTSLALAAGFVAVLALDVSFAESTNLSRAFTGMLSGAGAGLVGGGVLRSRWGCMAGNATFPSWWLRWASLILIVSFGPVKLALLKLAAVLAVVGVVVVLATPLLLVAPYIVKRPRAE